MKKAIQIGAGLFLMLTFAQMANAQKSMPLKGLLPHDLTVNKPYDNAFPGLPYHLIIDSTAVRQRYSKNSMPYGCLPVCNCTKEIREKNFQKLIPFDIRATLHPQNNRKTEKAGMLK